MFWINLVSLVIFYIHDTWQSSPEQTLNLYIHSFPTCPSQLSWLYREIQRILKALRLHSAGSMGALESKLYWSQTKADGTPRSMIAKLLDPVGACFEPADLTPFNFNEQDVTSAAPIATSNADETRDVYPTGIEISTAPVCHHDKIL